MVAMLYSWASLLMGWLLFDGQGKDTVRPEPVGGRWYGVVEGAVAAPVVLVSRVRDPVYWTVVL